VAGVPRPAPRPRLRLPVRSASALGAPAQAASPAAARARLAELPLAAWLLGGYLALWAALAVAPGRPRHVVARERAPPVARRPRSPAPGATGRSPTPRTPPCPPFSCLHAVGAHHGYPTSPPAGGCATPSTPSAGPPRATRSTASCTSPSGSSCSAHWRTCWHAWCGAGGGDAAGRGAAARRRRGVRGARVGRPRASSPPDTASTFVGAQGDPWDAQQDLASPGSVASPPSPCVRSSAASAAPPAGVGVTRSTLTHAARRTRGTPRSAPATRNAARTDPQ
jgi:hypothetical protein